MRPHAVRRHAWHQMRKEVKISHPAPGLEMEEVIEEPAVLASPRKNGVGHAAAAEVCSQT
jgi:hypothetical protein